MKMRKFLVTMSLLGIMALSGASLAADGDVGTPAIDYTLPVLGGGTYTLSDQIGQVVIMFVIGYS